MTNTGVNPYSPGIIVGLFMDEVKKCPVSKLRDSIDKVEAVFEIGSFNVVIQGISKLHDTGKYFAVGIDPVLFVSDKDLREQNVRDVLLGISKAWGRI